MNTLTLPFPKTLIFTFSLFLLSACSSMPGVYEGNDLSHLSLRDKRIADDKVRVLMHKPKASSQIGEVSAKRCQSSMFSEVPEKKTLLMDMKAEAYRLGANAISEVDVKVEGAFSEGCWNVYTATANMLVVEYTTQSQ